MPIKPKSTRRSNTINVSKKMKSQASSSKSKSQASLSHSRKQQNHKSSSGLIDIFSMVALCFKDFKDSNFQSFKSACLEFESGETNKVEFINNIFCSIVHENDTLITFLADITGENVDTIRIIIKQKCIITGGSSPSSNQIEDTRNLTSKLRYIGGFIIGILLVFYQLYTTFDVIKNITGDSHFVKFSSRVINSISNVQTSKIEYSGCMNSFDATSSILSVFKLSKNNKDIATTYKSMTCILKFSNQELEKMGFGDKTVGVLTTSSTYSNWIMQSGARILGNPMLSSALNQFVLTKKMKEDYYKNKFDAELLHIRNEIEAARRIGDVWSNIIGQLIIPCSYMLWNAMSKRRVIRSITA
jgi:hypothetical protein